MYTDKTTTQKNLKVFNFLDPIRDLRNINFWLINLEAKNLKKQEPPKRKEMRVKSKPSHLDVNKTNSGILMFHFLKFIF